MSLVSTASGAAAKHTIRGTPASTSFVYMLPPRSEGGARLQACHAPTHSHTLSHPDTQPHSLATPKRGKPYLHNECVGHSVRGDARRPHGVAYFQRRAPLASSAARFQAHVQSARSVHVTKFARHLSHRRSKPTGSRQAAVGLFRRPEMLLLLPGRHQLPVPLASRQARRSIGSTPQQARVSVRTPNCVSSVMVALGSGDTGS